MKKNVLTLVIGAIFSLPLSLFLITARHAQAAPQPDMPDQAMALAAVRAENKGLTIRIDRLNGVLEKDSRFVLREIDATLDDVEQNKTNIEESYSDWFVPTVQDLQSRGVAKWRLQRRIDRLLDLAKKGKYLSSYEKRVVTLYGIAKFQDDVNAILQ